VAAKHKCLLRFQTSLLFALLGVIFQYSLKYNGKWHLNKPDTKIICAEMAKERAIFRRSRKNHHANLQKIRV
jgi:hypothetical protein